jgi:hypothetical protein
MKGYTSAKANAQSIEHQIFLSQGHDSQLLLVGKSSFYVNFGRF